MAHPTVLMAFALTPNRFGSMETFAIELAHQLKARGWKAVFCFEGTPTPAVREQFLAVGNVTLDILKDQSGMSLGAARAFYRMARKHRPAVVMYWLGGVVRWWPLVGRLAGVRRTIYHDGSSRSAASFQYKAGAKVRAMMAPLDASICVTEFIKGCSDREGIVPAEKSHVIYSGVDNDREHGDGAGFRRRFGIPEDCILVIDVSWLVPEKGIGVALRAAAKALAVRDDLHFVFCGDGVNRPEYERLAVELKIDGHVTWAGQVEDLVKSGAFRGSDLQIQCSQWHEAFCLAVAEGMSAGLPVIAARIGGLPELVADGTNGLLFEPTSEDELAAAIVRLAEDKNLRLAMGERGRERALANHDLKQNVARWLDVLLNPRAFAAQ